MAAVPLTARVVEVIADGGESAHPRYRYGSGCIVVAGTVLTAAHVIAGARRVQVRDPNKTLYSATLDMRYVGDVDGPGPDLALLAIDDANVDLPPMPLAAVDRDSSDAEPIERCHAVGYPWFAQRPSPATVRDTADAFGLIPVLSNLASGLLSLQVSSSPLPLPPQARSLTDSEWSGMSGAPVVAAGCLCGVVTEHAAREGPSAITVTPLTALQSDPAHPGWGPGVADPAEWWARLGLRSFDQLSHLPHRRSRPAPTYRATLREIQARTARLLGRQSELAEINAFATGSDSYRWLEGGAWAGKTALLAEAVTSALPEDVDVVAYFLSRREGDADSNRFLAAIVSQLADLVDEETPAADVHQFRALWQQASDVAARGGRHLLLVVDGLDEDMRPEGLPSVAALLPAISREHAHILVSSRPYPELPIDVPVGHPLRACAPVTLLPFEGAAELAKLAHQEIDNLIRRDDDGLATDVLGILTAAAGPLAVVDLAALTTESGLSTPSHTRKVRRLVTAEAARSLQPVGPDASRRYQFAHASLLDYAESDQDLTDPTYRQSIDRWADQWRAQRWPPVSEGGGTPRYLLDSYPAVLAGRAHMIHYHGPGQARERDGLAQDPAGPLGEPSGAGLAALVGDIAWVDTAISAIGVDIVLSTLRTAVRVAPTGTTMLMLRLIQLQADQLRPPLQVQRPGYPATQLAWEALRVGAADLGTGANERLLACPAPQLIPQWSTERTSAGLVRTLGHHDGGVGALAVTADGSVVSGGDSGTLRLWKPAAADDRGRDLGHHGARVIALAVTPDGSVVSAGGNGTLRLWRPDVADSLASRAAAVRAVAVTPDGSVVWGGDKGNVMLWNPANTNDRGRRLGHHDGAVLAVAVTADGSVVCGSADGAVRLWNPAAAHGPGRQIGQHYRGVLAVAVTADGSVVSGSDYGTVMLWNPAIDGGAGRTIGSHINWWVPVRALAITPDGSVVSAGGDGTLWLWNPAIADDRGRYLGYHAAVWAVAATPDGSVVSGGQDGTLRLWNPALANDPQSRLGPQDGGVQGLAVTADGSIVSGDVDGAVRLWNPAIPNDPGRELGCHTAGVRAVAVIADGSVVSGAVDGTLRLWNPGIADDPGRDLGHEVTSVSAVAVTADGLVISGSGDGAVRLWNPAIADDPGRELGHHNGTVWALAVTADGSVISAGGDGAVRLWNPAIANDPGRELGHHDTWVSALAVTGDGSVISASRDGAVRLWNPAIANDPGRELGHHNDTVWALAVTARGSVISAGGDGAVWLWNPAIADDPGRQLAHHHDGVQALAVIAETEVVIATADGLTSFRLVPA